MQLPGPVRAVVGLVATAADEARHLPDRALELPMLAVSTALQASVRAQQRYARLTARGDALLNRRPPTDEPPEWATFDDPLPADELQHRRRSAFDAVDASSDGVATAADTATAAAQLLGGAVGRLQPGRSSAPRRTEPRTPPARQSAAETADTRDAVAEAQPADTKSPATKSTAKKTTAAKTTPAAKSAARKSTARKSAAKKTASRRSTAAAEKSAGAAKDTAPGVDG